MQMVIEKQDRIRGNSKAPYGLVGRLRSYTGTKQSQAIPSKPLPRPEIGTHAAREETN